eukprot:Skav203025  [mRNA]  locus=scaffold583:350729:354391:- [translate_table: standard]
MSSHRRSLEVLISPGISGLLPCPSLLWRQVLRGHGPLQLQPVARHAPAAAPDLGHRGFQGVPRTEAELQRLHLLLHIMVQ